MTTHNETLDSAEQAVLKEARRVNEERMTTVQDLAVIVAEKLDLEEQFKDNKRRERKAIRDAEKAGWTQAQIKRFMKPPQPKKATQPSNQQESNNPL